MKNIITAAITITQATISYSQTDVCECYEKVSNANFSDPGYQKCLEEHKSQFDAHEENVMRLYRSGKREEIEKIKDDPIKWQGCMLPELPAHLNKLSFIHGDSAEEISIVEMDGDFTNYNEFTQEGYIETTVYNYDPMKEWEQPDDAVQLKVTIVHNDSLKIEDFPKQQYPVKSEGESSEWSFYVEYKTPWGNYNGNYRKANPSRESYLTLLENTGRYWSFEFRLITEEGHEVKGTLLTTYSVPLR